MPNQTKKIKEKLKSARTDLTFDPLIAAKAIESQIEMYRCIIDSGALTPTDLYNRNTEINQLLMLKTILKNIP